MSGQCVNKNDFEKEDESNIKDELDNNPNNSNDKNNPNNLNNSNTYKSSIIRKPGFSALPISEQEIYCNKFIKKHKEILRKHLGLFTTSAIKQNFVNHFLFEPTPLNCLEKNMEETEFRFCDKPFKIPNTLNLIGNIIMNKPFGQKGIFRVPTTKQRMRTATSLLYDITENRVNLERGMELFDKNFDLIDCCELYKELLRSFNTTIMPYSFVDTILKISNVTDFDEKVICCKAVYYALPNINRCVLESNIYMCYAIVDKIEALENKSEQLNLDGLAMVMMPNLFLKKDQNVPIEIVLELVKLNKFFMENFNLMFTIDEE